MTSALRWMPDQVRHDEWLEIGRLQLLLSKYILVRWLIIPKFIRPFHSQMIIHK